MCYSFSLLLNSLCHGCVSISINQRVQDDEPAFQELYDWPRRRRIFGNVTLLCGGRRLQLGMDPRRSIRKLKPKFRLLPRSLVSFWAMRLFEGFKQEGLHLFESFPYRDGSGFRACLVPLILDDEVGVPEGIS